MSEQTIDVTISCLRDGLDYAKDLERRGFNVKLTTIWKDLNWWAHIEASKSVAPPAAQEKP